MKLFFTIFAAILAAASVVWGIASYRANQQAEAATRFKIMDLSAKNAKVQYENAFINGSFIKELKQSQLEGATILAKLLLDHPASELRSPAKDYTYYSRELIKVIREKIPEHKEWADELEPLIAKVEAATPQ